MHLEIPPPCRQTDQPLSPLPRFHKSPSSLRGESYFTHLTSVCMLFARQTCCAVVFCSKDCRRKASQGYHRFPESLTHNPAFSSRYECEMRLYELLPMEGKDMFGYFLALRWLRVSSEVCENLLECLRLLVRQESRPHVQPYKSS